MTNIAGSGSRIRIQIRILTKMSWKRGTLLRNQPRKAMLKQWLGIFQGTFVRSRFLGCLLLFIFSFFLSFLRLANILLNFFRVFVYCTISSSACTANGCKKIIFRVCWEITGTHEKSSEDEGGIWTAAGQPGNYSARYCSFQAPPSNPSILNAVQSCAYNIWYSNRGSSLSITYVLKLVENNYCCFLRRFFHIKILRTQASDTERVPYMHSNCYKIQ
jgi:hypothetical protein